MAQDVDIIDLRRSYVPLDPNAMPNTYHNTQGEDSPEARIPIIPYDGYNFMPTPQGYCSFFGISSRLNAASLFGEDAVEAVYEDPDDAAFWAAIVEDQIQYGRDTQQKVMDFLTGMPEGTATQQDVIDTYNAFYPEVVDMATLFATVFVHLEAPVGDLITPAVDAIPGTTNVDDIFMMQTATYQNIIVALCDDGIWTKRPNTGGAWTHVIELDVPALHRIWSKCVIDNIVYAYRQGEDHVWIASPDNEYTFTEATPTGINMSAQLGIFKAGGRLGFWDSENSTGWSSLTEPLEFGDSDKLSGFTIFQDIVGRVVVVLQHGDGFIIYATKSIVHVVRNPASAMLFQGRSVYNNNGISYRREAVFSDPDTTHFAFTTQGTIEITNGQAQTVTPEISTYLKEKKSPVFLTVLNGRYLYFQVMDIDFFTGIVSFSSEEVQGAVYSWANAAKAIDNVATLGNTCRALLAVERNFESYYMFKTFGHTSKQESSDEEPVPIWRDNLASVIPFATIEAWKTHTPGFFGDYLYFDDKFNAGTAITRIDGTGDEFLIPSGIPLASAYAQTRRQEANDQNFYMKQEFLWWAEERFYNDWIKAIENKEHGPFFATVDEYASTSGIARLPPGGIGDVITAEDHEYGPFLMPTFLGEANRDYGAADKSAWLGRSIIKGVKLTFRETVKVSARTTTETKWILTTLTNVAMAGSISMFEVYDAGVVPIIFNSYAEAMAAKTTIRNWLNANYPQGGVYGDHANVSDESGITYPTNGVTNVTRQINHYYQHNLSGAPQVAVLSPIKGDAYVIGATENAPDAYSDGLGGFITTSFMGEPQYKRVTTRAQTFYHKPGNSYVDFETCLYKELGYTDITGHGKYNLLGNFVQIDDIDEAPDYVDVCDTFPAKKKRPNFNGIAIGWPWNNGVLCGRATEDLEINGDSWAYPEEAVTIPDGEIFLQDGSPEPEHPDFIGAFVFDVHYKKWGKMFQPYKLLLDLFPINNIAGDDPIPYETFLPKAAVFMNDGYLHFLDQYPEDSYIVYGKYGQYRKGFTDLHEVRFQHRSLSNGYMEVQGSLNGRDIDPSVNVVKTFENTRHFATGINLSARWFNLIISGNYDLIHLEARSSRAGRR